MPFLKMLQYFLPDKRLSMEGMESVWSAVVTSGRGLKVQILNITAYDEITADGSSDTTDDDDENSERSHILREKQKFHHRSDGVQVIIHHPLDLPFPGTESVDVPPATTTTFAVRVRRVRRQGLPYGNCTNRYPLYDGSVVYRRKICLKTCVQKFVIGKRCGCFDDTLLAGYFKFLNMSVDYCQLDDQYPESCKTTVDAGKPYCAGTSASNAPNFKGCFFAQQDADGRVQVLPAVRRKHLRRHL